MEHSEFVAWIKSTKQIDIEILITAVKRCGLSLMEQGWQSDQEVLIKIVRAWRRGDGIDKIVRDIESPVSLPLEIVAPVPHPAPSRRAPGRPTGSCSKASCPFPWQGNKVRYMSDVKPAVLDILWRRGKLRVDEIVKHIVIEQAPDSLIEAREITRASLMAEVNRLMRSSLIPEIETVNGGMTNDTQVERAHVTIERTGWYFRGELHSVKSLARGARIHRTSLPLRIESGWDIEQARCQTGGKGAQKKRKTINTLTLAINTLTPELIPSPHPN